MDISYNYYSTLTKKRKNYYDEDNNFTKLYKIITIIIGPFITNDNCSDFR